MEHKYYWKRIIGDFTLILLAITFPGIAFYTDANNISNDLFLRSGAIMALFAAFLEFRTHEIQIQRQEDKFKVMWRTISVISEGLASVDRAAKIALRNQATVIQAAGMEPVMGRAEDIKDMVITESIKALQGLKPLPESYYRYNFIISIIGKSLVIAGTLIWSFGDYAVKSFNL
ncbi:hypothetical protein [Methylophilus sp.]|uniref:hypothetical protein n=1 Tax=Methylophilus sp. TaxID=29541 RepID=UPI004036CB7D